MYFHRTLERFLIQASRQLPVILVTGPRQVGKTTILQHLSKRERRYLTLDDPALAQLANDDPQLFLDRFRPPLLIDEIQYAPKLLPFIKMQVDAKRTPGLFWLTGSQPFEVMHGVSESLAGRIGVVSLLGLSQQELLGQALRTEPFLPTDKVLKKREAHAKVVKLDVLYRTIWRGSFPGLALNPKLDRDLFYSSYVQTYLQRDIRQLARVGDEAAFLRFIRSAAARTGQLLNLSEMARDTAVSVPTAKAWLSILESSGLVYLLEPYHTNVTKRLVKTAKLYFLDTGLASYLTEWTTPATLEAGAMSGAILETYLFTEILKSYWHSGKRPAFYYYRDKDQKEIDLLIHQDGTFYPLEFKKTAAPSKDMVKAFGLLESLGLKVGGGGLICLVHERLPLSKEIEAIPVGLV